MERERERARAAAPPAGRLGRTLSVAGRFLRYALGLDRPGVVYVTDSFQWALHEVGRALQSHVASGPDGIELAIAGSGRGHFGKVVHYGSQFCLAGPSPLSRGCASRLLFTWFHGDPADPDPVMRTCFSRLADAATRADRVVASCSLARAQLSAAGWPDARVSLIPLGVDLERFSPRTDSARAARRRELGIPPDAFCVGSFQKDGIGWGEGLEPKWVKGPDVLVEALDLVHREHPALFVLLLGPARGYVKAALERRGIRHRHAWVEPDEVPGHYDALDCYMVPSRTEGGPMALMQSMAKGVPVVSTRVGMSADLLADQQAGLLAEPGDAPGLARQCLRLAADPALAERLAAEARVRVQDYAWARIAARYVREVYRPLLSSLGGR
jgi:glycosyltransferase involved in cell wall biosynthesis